MKIGVLGGSFDPPHIGHQSLACQILAKTEINEVWLVPCFKNAFGKKMSPAKDRLMMAKMMEEPGIKVSDLEIKKEGISYTIETMDKLKRKHLGDEFFWIMGSDQIEFFPKYKAWQDILARHNLIIFPREKNIETIIKNIKKHWKLQNIPSTLIILNPKEFIINELSSTKIRETVRRRKSTVGLVKKEVEKYIFERKLYK